MEFLAEKQYKKLLQKCVALADLQKESQKALEEIVTVFEKDQLLKKEQVGPFCQQLQKLSDAEVDLCEEFKAIEIPLPQVTRDFYQHLDAWYEQQKEEAQKKQLQNQLAQVLTISYQKDDAKVRQLLAQLQGDVKHLLQLGLSWEELAKKTEAALLFLRAVETKERIQPEMAEALTEKWGAAIMLACVYRDFSLSADSPKETPAPVAAKEKQPEDVVQAAEKEVTPKAENLAASQEETPPEITEAATLPPNATAAEAKAWAAKRLTHDLDWLKISRHTSLSHIHLPKTDAKESVASPKETTGESELAKKIKGHLLTETTPVPGEKEFRSLEKGASGKEPVSETEKAAPVSEKVDAATKDQPLQHVYQLLQADRLGEALLSLRVLSQTRSVQPLYEAIGYLLADPLQPENEDGFHYAELFFVSTDHAEDQALALLQAGTLLQAFYQPVSPQDYRLEAYWQQFNAAKESLLLTKLPAIKQLLGQFKDFAMQEKAPFAVCAIRQGKDDFVLELEEKRLQKCLVDQYDRVQQECLRSSRHPRLRGLRRQLYGQGGKLLAYFATASGSNQDVSLADITDFIQPFLTVPLTADMDLTANFEELLNSQKITDYLDEVWFSIEVGERKNERFIGKDKTQQINFLKNSLALLAQFVVLKKKEASEQKTQIDPKILKKQRNLALTKLKELTAQLQALPQPTLHLALIVSVMQHFITRLTALLQGEAADSKAYYRPFLKTDCLELDKQGLPVVTDWGLPQATLSRRLEAHFQQLKEKNPTWPQAYQKALADYNLGLARLIAPLLDDGTEQKDLTEIADYGQQYLEKDSAAFQSDVKLAALYGQLSDRQQLTFYGQKEEEARAHFQFTQNYGFYQQFLQACRAQIKAQAQPRQAWLQQKWAALRKEVLPQAADEAATACFDQVKHWLQNGNLTLVEDSLHRCQGKDLAEIKQILATAAVRQPDDLLTFLTAYQSYYDICRRNQNYPFHLVLERWQDQHGSFRRGKKNEKGQEARDFAKNWSQLAENDQAQPAAAEAFLRGLSLTGSLKIQGKDSPADGNLYQLDWQPESGGKVDFLAGVLTAGQGSFALFVYRGANKVEDLVQAMLQCRTTAAQAPTGLLFLCDCALTLADRRVLAREMKLRPALGQVLFIDRVLALYLGQFDRQSRGDKFLRLALPFAFVQPYPTAKLASFFCRPQALRRLLDCQSPIFLYGGRQLGKSTLLKAACSLLQQQGGQAFLFDREEQADDLLAQLGEKLLQSQVTSWSDLVAQVITDLSREEAPQLALFFDHSDTWLKEMPELLTALQEIRAAVPTRFTFVFSSLHAPATLQVGLQGEKVLPLQPLTYQAATAFLERPLSYAGFICQADAVQTLLVQTNYLPGLIQACGRRLVQGLRANYQDHHFNVADTPPYHLQMDWVRALLRDDDFQKQLREKFWQTLAFGPDDYYAVIALILAYAYHDHGRKNTPISAAYIHKFCQDYPIAKMKDISEKTLTALLEEMTTFHLLYYTSGGYIFNHYRFYTLMGSLDEVGRKLDAYAE